VGCKEWKDFCKEHKLPLRECGKIVTAKVPEEMDYLNKLYEQGLKNGVELELIDRQIALEMEPSLRGIGDVVIYSPTTAVMDTQVALDCLMRQLNDLPNFKAEKGVKYIEMARSKDSEIAVKTDKGTIYSKFMINAAG
jgi:L-2-hydroxyglutarate oxidase LhgO